MLCKHGCQSCDAAWERSADSGKNLRESCDKHIAASNALHVNSQESSSLGPWSDNTTLSIAAIMVKRVGENYRQKLHVSPEVYMSTPK